MIVSFIYNYIWAIYFYFFKLYFL